MPKPTPVPLAEVDLSDLDAFARNEAWGMFDTLRREDPVHWNEERDMGSGFWAVTRYEDVCAVDKDAETFTSTKFVNLEEVDDDLMDIRRSILETDGPRHRALRKLIQREFSAGNLMRNYEDFLRGLTRQTVDEALQSTEFDFVEKISADFPIQVLARLLDVPSSDTDQLIDWGNQMVGNTDPDYTDYLITDPDSDKYKQYPFRTPVSLDVFEYGRELARKRKGGDGTDLVSMLVNKLPEDGQPLSDTDFDNYFLLLVIAGNETTRHAISQSMLGADREPGPAAQAAGGPEPDPAGRRGDAALGLAGLPLPPYRDPRRGDGRQADQGRRQGRHVVRLRQPGRVGVRGPVPLRRHPQGRRPRDVRQGQPAPVPGQHACPDGDPADVRGAAAAAEVDRARR